MDWQAQKMNIITGVMIVVIGGMVAYKLHVFGGSSGAPKPAPTAASFAGTPTASRPAASLPTAQYQAVKAPAAVPVTAMPAPAATPPGSSDSGASLQSPPAAISMGAEGSDTGVRAGVVTPLASPSEASSSASAGKLVPVAALNSMQVELVQMQREIQALSTAMGRMDAHTIDTERHLEQRLHRVAKRSHDPFAGAAMATRSAVAGYRLQSIGETEAWLSNPDGETVIARAGEHLPGLTILAVAPQGVKTSAGWLGF